MTKMKNAAKDFSRFGQRSKKISDGVPLTGKKVARVVIADDDALILTHLAEMLNTEFDVVALARNGLELVDAVARFAPEVVLSDVMMPEMNGIEAVRKITANAVGVKVLMMSGYKEPAIIEEALNAGASGFIEKIRFFTELVPALQSILEGRSYWPDDVWNPPLKVANSE
jgi:DNA-binding NarL/FixJ family response regulator